VSDALSKERIAGMRARMADNLVTLRAINGDDPASTRSNRVDAMTQGETETILALIDERARLIAVRLAGDFVCERHQDEYVRGCNVDALETRIKELDAWKAGT
jgi:hypothetical protein